RPRIGACKTPRVQTQYTRLDDFEVYDSGPRQEGMRRWHTVYHGWECKEQTDLLGPLHRFLQSQVGQDWDNVWAEICHDADARALMGLHLRFHAWCCVAQVTRGTDSKLYDTQGRELNQRLWKFYIDPATNQLRVVERQTSHTRRVSPRTVFAVDG